MFPPLLFRTLRLLFFPNLPTLTFLPDTTFISHPRVGTYHTSVVLIGKKENSSRFQYNVFTWFLTKAEFL